MEEKVFKRLMKEIEEKGDLLFPEIEAIFMEEKFDYKGDKYLSHPKNKNLIIWTNWNENANNIILKLLEEPNIVALQCNSIEIAVHGLFLDFPIANSENYNYKKPHWFPTKLQWKK